MEGTFLIQFVNENVTKYSFLYCVEWFISIQLKLRIIDKCAIYKNKNRENVNTKFCWIHKIYSEFTQNEWVTLCPKKSFVMNTRNFKTINLKWNYVSVIICYFFHTKFVGLHIYVYVGNCIHLNTELCILFNCAKISILEIFWADFTLPSFGCVLLKLWFYISQTYFCMHSFMFST